MLKGKKFIKKYMGTIIILIVAFSLYSLATDVCNVLDPILFPGFLKIGVKFYDSMPLLWKSLISSLSLLIPGYFGAAFSGILLGILIGTNPWLNKNLRPIIFALNPIPPSMMTPYLIAIMPTFYLSSVAVIFIGCFWPFLNGTINGIVLIDQKYLDNAKILELKGFTKLFKVMLPAAAPSILAGAGTALNFAFILLAIAEMFATNSGLGYFIQYYADFSDYARVIAGLLFMGFFIVIVMLLFEKLKKKILFWTLNENK
ncbi:ABC transporter permease [Hathewaya massiliensis]|uniref:ABC transporter permease n=1 Tax=Hathewaya massiliensis TaxID=1964382 RepID=UPI001158613A|nr:ABC transporter permease subunit [Hathewaya massiliensis]